MFLVENQIKLFIPEFFFASAFLFIVLQTSLLLGNKAYKNPLLVQITLQFCNFLLLIFLVLQVNACAINFSAFSNLHFLYDNLSLNVKCFLIFFSILVLFFCSNHILETKINLFEYPFLKVLTILSLCFLVMVNDLLGLYVIIEIQSLCLYVLASFKRNSAFSTEAGLKYFLLGSLASCLLLLGIAFIYSHLGITDFQNIYSLTASLEKSKFLFNPLNVGLLFLLAGFLFKLAIFPFHMWIADVYEGSAIPSTIFFSIVPKMSIFIILIRIFQESFYFLFFNWEPCLAFLAVFSIGYGSFIAIKQKKMKRLFAISSIGHMGYALLAFSTSTPEGLQSMIVYLVIYVITGFLTWSIVLVIESLFNGENTKTLADISNFFKLNGAFSLVIASAFFSLAGIPPFSGFYAKLSVLCSVVNASFFFYAIVAFLVSVVSCFYYLRVIKNAYFEKHLKSFSYIRLDSLNSFFVSILTSLLAGLFVNPNPLLLTAQKMILFF